MDADEAQRSPSPSLMVLHTAGTTDAVISHSLCETLPRQESRDPGKTGQRARTRCIRAGQGSPGSGTISVKRPVNQ